LFPCFILFSFSFYFFFVFLRLRSFFFFVFYFFFLFLCLVISAFCLRILQSISFFISHLLFRALVEAFFACRFLAAESLCKLFSTRVRTTYGCFKTFFNSFVYIFQMFLVFSCYAYTGMYVHSRIKLFSIQIALNAFIHVFPLQCQVFLLTIY